MKNKKIIIILIAIIAIVGIASVGVVMVLNDGNLTLDTDAYVVWAKLDYVEGSEINFNQTFSHANLNIGNLENGPYSAEFIFYDANGKELSKETVKAIGGDSPQQRIFTGTLKDLKADHVDYKIFDQGNLVFNGTITK